MDKKKLIKSLVIIFVISLILEIFVFNFRFFTTLGYDEININKEKIEYGKGLEYDEDNLWTNSNGELVPSFCVKDKKHAYFEIKDINAEVKNIYIDIENTKRKSYSNKKTILKFWATDEANELYFALPTRDIVRDVEKSKYINFNLSGESEKFKIDLITSNNNRFIINNITINKNEPMFFSFIRLFAVFLIISAVYIIRPKSVFYKYILNLKSKRQKIVLGILIAVHITGFVSVSLLNPNFVFMRGGQHQQYQMLTDSILKGHVYLDVEPSKALQEMENPYDTNKRAKVLKEAGEKFLWDRAYYEGKYYVYFGIVPVLVYYLPFKLITGMDFPNFAGVAITAIFFIFAVLGLIHQIIKRWFKNVPFLLYILLSFFFIDSCGIMYLLKRPDFYSIPIIMALTFSVSGLYFWISSMKYKDVKINASENDENTSLELDENEEVSYDDYKIENEENAFLEFNENEEVSYDDYKIENEENAFLEFNENEEISYDDYKIENEENAFSELNQYEKISVENYKTIDIDDSEVCENSKKVFDGFITWRLVVGSICMALVAGCRPQVLLGSFFAVPLFWNVVFKDRKLFSKSSIKNTILFILPYIIVAAGLMYYNYIRFGSVFDFGANYNLTTNDMTSRGFSLGRSPLGIFVYLFQPPAYSPRFPFISDPWFYTNYMGTTIHEFLFGGILFNHFLLCINLFVFKFKNSLKLKGLYYFCLSSILFSVIIVVADTQIAGLLQRYMVDFAWLMFIPAIILILILLERVNDYLKKHIYTILVCGFLFSFYYDFATIFFYGDEALYNINPTIHYTVAHLVQFWL